MGTTSRRQLLVWPAVLASGVGIGAYFTRAGKPASAEWLRDRLWGERLVAYAVWDGVPRVALVTGNRMAYDTIVAGDWIWPNWPPAPQWQMKGWGYSIAATDAPASIGVAPCPGFRGESCGWPLELYGQVNDPSIVTMEVRFSEGWQRFAVARPGFALRLDENPSWPSAYRWCDIGGHIVWEMNEFSSSRPGVRGARPHRGARQRATPIAIDSNSG